MKEYEEKTTVTSVSFPSGLKKLARKAAHENEQSLSAYIQDALYEKLFNSGHLKERYYARKDD